MGDRELPDVRDWDIISGSLHQRRSMLILPQVSQEKAHTRAMASTSQKVTMIKAPSPPPTPVKQGISNVPRVTEVGKVARHIPSLAFKWSYRKTILALDNPSFSGLCRIFFRVLMNRGSLGATKKTKGAIKIDASRTSLLS